jgi:hypothetical protein
MLRSDGDVTVRWQPSAWGVVCGLEKNAFAAAGYSIWGIVVVILAHAVLLAWPYAATIAYADGRALGYAAAIVFAHMAFGLAGWAFAGDWRVFPMLPLAAGGLLFAFCRSAAIALRQGGIRWRETFYPLDELRGQRLSGKAIRAARARAGGQSVVSLPAEDLR